MHLFQHHQAIFFQGFSTFHDIHDHIGQAHNGCQFNGAIQVNNFSFDSLLLKIFFSDIGIFGSDYQLLSAYFRIGVSSHADSACAHL